MVHRLGGILCRGIGWAEFNTTQCSQENDFGLYDTIKSIGKRLKGTLGKHLLQLQYTKNDACIAYHKDSDPLPYKDTASISEFTIFDDNLPEYPLGTHYFNVGFTKFKPKQTSPLKGDYYFLLRH
jgi:hypothetical protein